MIDVLAALEHQLREFDALLAALTPDDWARESRCAGWTMADVVVHLEQTNQLAIASLEGRFGEFAAAFAPGEAASIDAAAEASVEYARTLAQEQGPEGLRVAWTASADTMLAAFEATERQTRVQWVAGTLSAHTLTTTRLAETWIHTNDVAVPLGREHPPDERLWHIARLAWRTLPYAFGLGGNTLSGPVAFRLLGPSGEPWDFESEDGAITTVHGPALDLCAVAARRLDPALSGLSADGPDAPEVLSRIRTYA